MNFIDTTNYDPPVEKSVENFNNYLGKARSPTVFIPNKSGHDFSASSKYGSPIFVTQGMVNRFSVMHMARKWYDCLLQSTKEDYILITSLTILTVVGSAIFGWMHGRINLLVFRNNKYIARTIIFENLSKEIEDDDKEAL